MSELVQLEIAAPNVVRLVLNRPQARNAFSAQMLTELNDAISNIPSDAAAVVITAEGPAFCAGADLKERRSMTHEQTAEFLKNLNAFICRVEDLPQFTVCAIEGYCLGGGLELALACDARLANENAVFAMPEVSLGIIPGAGGPWRLPRLVGSTTALKWIATAQRFSAAEAAADGVVTLTNSPREDALALANQVAQHSKVALKHAKLAVRGADFFESREKALAYERALYMPLLDTPERQAALERFAQKKQKPQA